MPRQLVPKNIRPAAAGGNRWVCRSLVDPYQSASRLASHSIRVWTPIDSAPFDLDLQLAVLETDGAHSLIFPCRRVIGGWVSALDGGRIDIRPTHWRLWDEFKPTSP